MKNVIDLSSEDGLVLSLAYAAVFIKFGGFEGFTDWIEENITGNAFDIAISAKITILRWGVENPIKAQQIEEAAQCFLAQNGNAG